MIIGVPKETKAQEYRVAMLPAGVEQLTIDGHTLLVESGAGAGSGITDDEFSRAGAVLLDSAAELWSRADLVVKVKEPEPHEVALIRRDQLLFTYFHLAASEALTRGLLAARVTALAYETLEDEDGRLPLLTPMSEVAGRMSVQEGARCLERPERGRGVLLGGVPGVEPAHVTVVGGGVVGASAAKVAAGFGARVTILDTDLDRLRHLSDIMPKNVVPLFSDRHTLKQELACADLVIGAVLVRGARAPRLIERADLRRMKQGSVIVDVAVDQGGCAETSRPTTHANPTFVVDDVVHYCVANMPGAVGRTSSYALCNATAPYIRLIANHGLEGAVRKAPRLVTAINLHRGRITYRAVAATFGLEFTAYPLCEPVKQDAPVDEFDAEAERHTASSLPR